MTADTVAELPPAFAPLGDGLRRGRAVRILTRLGLIRHTDAGLVMHRLVQTVLRDHTSAADRTAIIDALPCAMYCCPWA